MRIIVLGGAGDMGSRAVEEFAATADVEQVTIADRNLPAAHQLAARLAGRTARVDVRAVDALCHAELVEALAGHDVAASSLGPFHLFESRLIRAAIEAGVDYASICDESTAAEEVFAQFADEARQRGRTIITGLGASPGISNVGVRYLAEQFAEPRRADISCYQPLDAGGGPAVLSHMLFIMTGDVRIHRDGRPQTIRACSERRQVEFPRFGTHAVWNMGHSEPFTLPRFLHPLQEVNFYLGFGRGSALMVEPARWGFYNGPRRRGIATKILSTLDRWTKPAQPGIGAIRIDMWGRDHGGQEAHRLLCGTGQMREATGVSLAIGTLMLGRRELTTTAPGLYAPEGCLDPRRFIAELRQRGIESYADLAMSQPVA